MKKKDIFLFICFIIALEKIFMEPNFGFVPLDGAEGFGYDIIPAIAFVGGFWFVYNFIKALKEKNKNKVVENQKIQN